MTFSKLSSDKSVEDEIVFYKDDKDAVALAPTRSDSDLGSESAAVVKKEPSCLKRDNYRALLIALLVFVGCSATAAGIFVGIDASRRQRNGNAMNLLDLPEIQRSPTDSPTLAPTAPTASPSSAPTGAPSASPTGTPTATPSASPTASPSAAPTGTPSASPSASPSAAPTVAPTGTPSAGPTSAPTATPTQSPTPEGYIYANPEPLNPPPGYFNYDPNSEYGPKNWHKVNTNNHWLREFGPSGFGPWNGFFNEDLTKNNCGGRARKQSPKDLVLIEECLATHEIRTEVSAQELQILACLSLSRMSFQ